jgi:hypothetical protein
MILTTFRKIKQRRKDNHRHCHEKEQCAKRVCTSFNRNNHYFNRQLKEIKIGYNKIHQRVNQSIQT